MNLQAQAHYLTSTALVVHIISWLLSCSSSHWNKWPIAFMNAARRLLKSNDLIHNVTASGYTLLQPASRRCYCLCWLISHSMTPASTRSYYHTRLWQQCMLCVPYLRETCLLCVAHGDLLHSPVSSELLFRFTGERLHEQSLFPTEYRTVVNNGKWLFSCTVQLFQ